MDKSDGNFLPNMIGRYEVKSLLGSGAMGSVYLAEDPRIKRRVAIKVVRLDVIKNETERSDYLARFQREAEVSGVLNDPGIVTIYDVGESDCGPFLAMEYVSGRSLDEYVKAPDMLGLTLARKLQIAASIAVALDHAHAHGIVHRDVKPGNVMITEDGRPKLMDFGIAKREDANLTQTGTFLGTPSYASPEQIIDGRATIQSDVFSFGVMVFEMLSGVLPFGGNSINTILYRIVNEPPIELRPPVLGILPEGWQRIFSKGLSKDPEERYPNCAAFMMDLLEAVTEIDKDTHMELLGFLKHGGKSVVGTPILSKAHDETLLVHRKKPKKGSGTFWVMTFAVILVAGLGGYYLFGKNRQAVTFMVEPSAKVMMEGREIGSSGAPIPLKKGAKITLVREGYDEQTYIFDGTETQPSLTLKPKITEEILRTVPEGANAVMDGVPVKGVTPVKINAWDQSKKHDLTFTHNSGSKILAVQFGEGETPGNSVYTLVTIVEAAKTGEVKTVDANAPGYLRINGDFPVQVFANGRELKTGSGKVSLQPGSYKLEMVSRSVYYHENRSITIQPGQTHSLNLPGLANLTVFHPAGDVVLIDGVSTGIESDGSTPIRVAKGRHQITIQGRAASQNVEIKRDQTVKFKL